MCLEGYLGVKSPRAWTNGGGVGDASNERATRIGTGIPGSIGAIGA